MEDEMNVNIAWKNLINREFVKWQNRQGMPMLKQDFATYLGVDEVTLSHWFAGRRPPVGDRLDSLAAILGTDVYEATGKPPRLPDNPSLKRVARILPMLPPRIQESFAEWVEEDAEQVNDPEQENVNLSFQLSTP